MQSHSLTPQFSSLSEKEIIRFVLPPFDWQVYCYCTWGAMLEFDQRVQKIMRCALKIFFFLVRFLWEIHFLFPSPSKKSVETISVIISPIYLQNYAFQSRLTFACCKMALFNYSKVFLSFPHLLCLSH